MVARQGLPSNDLEFVQFHPTGMVLDALLLKDVMEKVVVGLIQKVKHLWKDMHTNC